MSSDRVSSQRQSTVDRRADLFREAISVVRTDYGEDLSLDDVARRLASSRRQLQRVFSDIGRTSFRWVLLRTRVAMARELLARTELPVATVAARVGYRHPAQFSKAFRRCVGVSPSGFRSAYRRRTAAAEDASDAPARDRGQ